MKKTAFTMIELVMVIVVLGILAALAMPRMDRDLRQEAADNVLSAIRYTQHLALVDDKTDPFDPIDTNWQKKLWQIRFSESSSPYALYYTIASNADHNNNLDQLESAIDPANGKYMHSTDASMGSSESPNIFLTKKYGISTMTFNDCQGSQNTTAKHIAFDHLGRPHRGVTQGGSNDYRTYVSNKNCQIIFNSPSFDPFTIIIEKETGYTYIVGQPDS